MSLAPSRRASATGGGWAPRSENNMRGRLLAIAPVLLIGAWSACGGSEPSKAPVDDASSDTPDAHADRGDTSASPVTPDPPRPAWVPDGWVLDRTYDKSCSFWVPAKREQLPPSLEWGSCPSTASPPGSVCEVVKASNTDGVSADAAWTSSSKGLVLLITQPLGTTPPSSYRILAQPDGEVLSAILSTDYARCAFTPFLDGAGDHYSLSLLEYGSSNRKGALFGRVDAISPTAAIRAPTQVFSSGIYATHFGAIVAADGKWSLHDWTIPSSSAPFW